MVNVLQNSLEHTSNNGSIIISVLKEDSRILLRIADTGKGIAVTDLPNIFKRFYKGNTATGTGLGLSIVKEIVDQHHGQVSVESVEGKGTTFSISFPLV